MTWSAAFPGATVRVLRAVVGRRALQVGLLVGGLFVLGFLCGEQAQAADGIGALPGRTVGQLVKPPAEPKFTPHMAMDTTTTTTTDTAKAGAPQPVAAKPGADAPTHPSDDKVLRPVTEDVVGAVVSGVVQPVGELVGTVTTGLTETVGIPAQPPLPGWPTMAQFPESPSWPTLPTLPTVPSAPTVPGLPAVPGQTLPAPAPVTSAPQPQSDDHAAGKSAGDEESADGGGVYGPRFAGHGTVTESVARPSAHRTTSTPTSTSAAHAPAHQAPSDNRGGALGGKSAVDSGSSRHTDAHAITPDQRAPLRLVAGAAASVDAAGTRDRHRDIPVFPG
ncbi:hypothetical protein ACIRP7_08420 [Streptomyces sp. NPDC102270]|uniref:hypothetical protein n=1 Tax=Streptomyces sp. NPDC102270 TaxID=3366150 RepID=UPI00382B9070